MLRGEQSAVLAQLRRLTELRNRKDLQLLADMGFSFRPNQFTGLKGIGVTVSNPVPLLQQGSPNVFFYAPGGDAGSKRADFGTLGHDEGWYVLDGEVEFEADGQSLPAREGSFVYLPAGTDCAFEVKGGTARAVYVTASSGQQRRTALKPYVLEPGEGEKLTVGGSPYFLKATKTDTGSAFSFMEINLKQGGEPPPHIHHLEVEVFHLIDGEVTFLSGGQTIPAQSGGLVQLPVGLPHIYGAQGDGTVKALLIALPAGLEELFRTLDKLGSKPPTAAQARQTGVEPVVPPPGAG